jgi:predicted TIM-barrel fold metal-dependent hydrolase
MLAGLAPLHRERLLARGGEAGRDPGVFLDVSSYGERAIDAVLREIGVDQLVYGSDRPVALPSTSPERDLATAAPARLMGWI